MHPIERLRYVARATGAPGDDVFREAVSSLAGFASDPMALVTACRRLVDRHPANGLIWWLCARTLTAADPADEAWRCLDEHVTDPTGRELAHALPDGGRVVVLGHPWRVGEGLARRGDLEVRVVDVAGDGPGFVRELAHADVGSVDVPVTGLASAADTADVVLLEASAVGPETAVCEPGSWALAAVARTSGRPVWLTGGAGRMVPAGLWEPLVERLRGLTSDPWSAAQDLVPLGLVDRIVGPRGPVEVAAAVAAPDVPDVADLRR